MLLPSFIMLDPDEVKSPAEIRRLQSKVQAIYDTGKPFFTKKVFRQVVQAFDRKDGVVRVTGVDGVIVGFRLRDEEDDSDKPSIVM